MELLAKIELDPGELWEEEIKGNVDELLQEEIPGYFCEIEDRAEWLEEKYAELDYRVDELVDYETEDHEARIVEVEERLSDLSEELGEGEDYKEKIAELEINLEIDKVMIFTLESQIRELKESVDLTNEYLVETIRQHVADALADARITL